MIDGTYFHSWCLLVATNATHVIGWQWTARENAPAYLALLDRFAPPDLVITDGHAGAYKAITTLWPGVPFQRCFFHIRQRVRSQITLHPRTLPGIEINSLTQALSHVRTPTQAATWLVSYHQWETRWDAFLKERTY